MNTELIDAVSGVLDRATVSGLYPIVAYGMADSGITVLTTNIQDLPYALRILRVVTGCEYNLGYHVPRQNLEKASRENPHVFRIHNFDIAGINQIEPASIGKIVRMFGSPFFPQKAFGLVDMVGFSHLDHAAQLSFLYALNNMLSSSMKRCYKFCQRLGLQNKFGSSSTGDGFYLWHDTSGGHADVATFMLLACIMVQSESMRQDGFALRLRGIYVIDSAFMIYTHRESFSIDAQATTAVGAATNGAARLSTAARPSQILVGDFQRPGQGKERMDPNSLLAQVNELFREEQAGAATLTCNPDQHLRVEDKHGDLWYCWNVCGDIPNAGTNRPDRQRVGLPPDSAHDIHSIQLKSEP